VKSLVKVFVCKVWPQGLRKDEFSIRCAPEKEVADSSFATGANKQIDWTFLHGLKSGAEQVYGDLVRTDEPLGDLFAEFFRGVGDFLAPTIGESEAKGHLFVLAGFFHESVQRLSHPARQFIESPDGAESDLTFVELLSFTEKKVNEKCHQGRHLFIRSVPVLFTKSEEGESRDSDSSAVPNDSSDRFCTFPMPFRTRLVTRLSPTAVTVHDDSEVTGQPHAHSSAHRARVPWELGSFKTSASFETLVSSSGK